MLVVKRTQFWPQTFCARLLGGKGPQVRGSTLECVTKRGPFFVNLLGSCICQPIYFQPICSPSDLFSSLPVCQSK